MKRQVECQDKQVRVIRVRGATPDTGEEAPELDKTEVYTLFYDADSVQGHRNVYPLNLTPEEAKAFKVGKIYTLTIE